MYTKILDDSKTVNPILKICPPQNPRGYNGYKCFTELCIKDEDCFSGMCQNGVCINNSKLDYTIYRCSSVANSTTYSMRCGKVGGMECGSDVECYDYNCQFSHKSYCGISSGIKFTMEAKKLIIFIVIGIALLL